MAVAPHINLERNHTAARAIRLSTEAAVLPSPGTFDERAQFGGYCLSDEEEKRLSPGIYRIEVDVEGPDGPLHASTIFQKLPGLDSDPLQLAGATVFDVVHRNASLARLYRHGPPASSDPWMNLCGPSKWEVTPLWGAGVDQVVFADQDGRGRGETVWRSGSTIAFEHRPLDVSGTFDLVSPWFWSFATDPYQAGELYVVRDVFGLVKSPASLFLARSEGSDACEAWRWALPDEPLLAKPYESGGKRHIGVLLRRDARFVVMHVVAEADSPPAFSEETAVPVAALPQVASAGAAVDDGVFRFSFVATLPDGRASLVTTTFGEDGARTETLALPDVGTLRVGRAALVATWPAAPNARTPVSHEARWVLLDERGHLAFGGVDAKPKRARLAASCNVTNQVPGSPFLSDAGFVAQQSAVGAPIFEGCQLLVPPDRVEDSKR
jgi:hypothetical protein